MGSRTPLAEVEVDARLVRGLLRAQHPDLAERPLALAAAGWDNVTFRLGDDLAVRLPRREVAADLLRHEQQWLGRLAAHLPLPIPVPVRTGGPGDGFPWPWSVVPWLAGATADLAPPAEGAAEVLGRFLRALHRPAPPRAPRNPARGVPLRAREPTLRARLVALDGVVDDTAVLDAWQRATRLPPAAETTWIHGDLHPRNLLVADGRLQAVIDWGDVGAGDPATDLMVAWALFGSRARAALLDAYGATGPSLVGRARGWALLFGTTLLDVGHHDDDPAFAAVGRRLLAEVLAES